MKKIITMFLTAAMCVGMTIPALAANSVTIKQPYDVDDGMREIYTINNIQNAQTKVTVGETYYSDEGCTVLHEGDIKTVYEVPVGQPIEMINVHLIEVDKAEIRDGKVYLTSTETGLPNLFDDLTTGEEILIDDYIAETYSGPLNITKEGYYIVSAYVSGSPMAPEMQTLSSVIHAVDGSTPVVSTGFTDVADNAYYADAVKWAVNNKITAGTTDTTFSPDQTCTRAQILTFLWRANGSPVSKIDNPFEDIDLDTYYAAAAAWAYEYGMQSGDIFGADTPCTRAATMVYLWKLAGSPEVQTNTAFTDVAANADYAQAVAWAVNNGITSGTSATTFSPDDICTRGQIMTFLYRSLAQ